MAQVMSIDYRDRRVDRERSIMYGPTSVENVAVAGGAYIEDAALWLKSRLGLERRQLLSRTSQLIMPST